MQEHTPEAFRLSTSLLLCVLLPLLSTPSKTMKAPRPQAAVATILAERLRTAPHSLAGSWQARDGGAGSDEESNLTLQALGVYRYSVGDALNRPWRNTIKCQCQVSGCQQGDVDTAKERQRQSTLFNESWQVRLSAL